MAIVEIRKAGDDVSLPIAAGEFFTLLGPSNNAWPASKAGRQGSTAPLTARKTWARRQIK